MCIMVGKYLKFWWASNGKNILRNTLVSFHLTYKYFKYLKLINDLLEMLSKFSDNGPA